MANRCLPRVLFSCVMGWKLCVLFVLCFLCINSEIPNFWRSMTCVAICWRSVVVKHLFSSLDIPIVPLSLHRPLDTFLGRSTYRWLFCCFAPSRKNARWRRIMDDVSHCSRRQPHQSMVVKSRTGLRAQHMKTFSQNLQMAHLKNLTQSLCFRWCVL